MSLETNENHFQHVFLWDVSPRCGGPPLGPVSTATHCGPRECGGAMEGERGAVGPPQGDPMWEEEGRVESSQASPVFHPVLHLRKLLELPIPALSQEDAQFDHNMDTEAMCATLNMADPMSDAPATPTHSQTVLMENMEAEPVSATPKMATNTMPSTPPTAKVMRP